MEQSDPIAKGTFNAQTKFVEQILLKHYRQQCDNGICPSFLTPELYDIYQKVSDTQKGIQDPSSVRGVMLTISPKFVGVADDVIDSFFADYVNALLDKKNFIPEDENVWVVERKTKEGEPTHPHLHLTFPNIHAHSKTNYLNRCYSSLNQLVTKYEKKYPMKFTIVYTKQSVDIVNAQTYEKYVTYVTKNVPKPEER